MPTQNVSLSPKQARFIKSALKQGHFTNASEVVRAGLRLLETQQQVERLKLKHLRQLAKNGFTALDEGDFRTVTSEGLDGFFDELDGRVKTRVSKASQAEAPDAKDRKPTTTKPRPSRDLKAVPSRRRATA